MLIIDVTNPAAPAEAGFYGTQGYAIAVAAAGNYAYVSEGARGLFIFRILNI
ncbi:MAG: hypothetical protein JSV68_09475 [Anaerolineaceae bacterium]|nr:MAG: hypothetical protein JSV68_09475 [Anaerolineaceae bacterium]